LDEFEEGGEKGDCVCLMPEKILLSGVIATGATDFEVFFV
jgi:hypothetical protein